MLLDKQHVSHNSALYGLYAYKNMHTNSTAPRLPKHHAHTRKHSKNKAEPDSSKHDAVCLQARAGSSHQHQNPVETACTSSSQHQHQNHHPAPTPCSQSAHSQVTAPAPASSTSSSTGTDTVSRKRAQPAHS